MESIWFWVLAIVIAIIVFVRFFELVQIERIVLAEFERGVKVVRGRYVAVLGPGEHFFRTYTSRVIRLDMRSKRETIDGQEVLTLDGVGIRISLVAEYAIADPLATLLRIQYPEQALYLAVQIALREVVTSLNVDTLLEQREAIGAQVLEHAAPRVAEFGYALSAVAVRDIMFPGSLKRTMAATVEARKEAEASLERARGEAATMRSLANTARMLDKNPALLHLRLLQSLERGGEHTLVLQLGNGAMPAGTVPAGVVIDA